MGHRTQSSIASQHAYLLQAGKAPRHQRELRTLRSAVQLTSCSPGSTSPIPRSAARGSACRTVGAGGPTQRISTQRFDGTPGRAAHLHGGGLERALRAPLDGAGPAVLASARLRGAAAARDARAAGGARRRRSQGAWARQGAWRRRAARLVGSTRTCRGAETARRCAGAEGARCGGRGEAAAMAVWKKAGAAEQRGPELWARTGTARGGRLG